MIHLAPHCDLGAQAGHLLANWLTGYALAKRYGLRFVHQPTRDWEEFLRFGEGEVHLKDVAVTLTLPLLDLDRQSGIDQFEQFIRDAKDGDVIRLAHNQNLGDHSPMEPFLKEKYWKYHQPATCYQEGRTKVAVHIRRGDILNLPHDEMLSRFFPNSYYLEQIDKVVRSNPNLDIHIFSEGNESDFADDFRGYSLHINENKYETFNSMCSADILILSKSGFSYIAGLISYGLKIAPSGFWHGYPKEWIRV